jgi:hypothetical protein
LTAAIASLLGEIAIATDQAQRRQDSGGCFSRPTVRPETSVSDCACNERFERLGDVWRKSKRGV